MFIVSPTCSCPTRIQLLVYDLLRLLRGKGRDGVAQLLQLLQGGDRHQVWSGRKHLPESNDKHARTGYTKAETSTS